MIVHQPHRLEPAFFLVTGTAVHPVRLVRSPQEQVMSDISKVRVLLRTVPIAMNPAAMRCPGHQ